MAAAEVITISEFSSGELLSLLPQGSRVKIARSGVLGSVSGAQRDCGGQLVCSYHERRVQGAVLRVREIKLSIISRRRRVWSRDSALHSGARNHLRARSHGLVGEGADAGHWDKKVRTRCMHLVHAWLSGTQRAPFSATAESREGGTKEGSRRVASGFRALQNKSHPAICVNEELREEAFCRQGSIHGLSAGQSHVNDPFSHKQPRTCFIYLSGHSHTCMAQKSISRRLGVYHEG